MKDIFDDIFKIFDFDGDGKVDNGEFAMAMTLAEAILEEDDEEDDDDLFGSPFELGGSHRDRDLFDDDDDDDLFGDSFGSDNDFDDDF